LICAIITAFSKAFAYAELLGYVRGEIMNRNTGHHNQNLQVAIGSIERRYPVVIISHK
jgi:hypothetical protein